MTAFSRTTKAAAMDAQLVYSIAESKKGNVSDWLLRYFKNHRPYACDGRLDKDGLVKFVGSTEPERN